jgi:hypothetical protein
VYVESGSQRWGCSELYDGANYNGLSFASAEAYPDDLVTLKVDHRQVLLFGQESTEIWYNSGQAGFPFERLAGGFIEYGTLARHGVAKQDNSVFWLANDRTIRRLTGQTPVRVSQHGMEEKLSAYSRVDDCEAFPYNWNGHLFVTFRFPTVGATWTLDVTTGEWHERESYSRSVWDVCDAVHCYGREFVQNATTGAIGYLSDSTHTESEKRIYHSQLDIVMRTGDAAAGVTPYVNLDYSDDGGSTWTQLPGRQLVSRGTTGEYSQVIRFTRLGMARDRVYRVWSADAAPFVITDTQLAAAAGAQ